MIYALSKTSNKNGPIYKVFLTKVIETNVLSVNNAEAYDFVEKCTHKGIAKIGEKMNKIDPVYYCENINNIFYIVITESENGNHEYIIVRDKSTKEFDHFYKIK